MKVPLLNFEGGPGVPLLNFRGVSGATFELLRGSRVPRSQVPESWSHFYTMPLCWRLFSSQNIARFLRAHILKNICESCFWKCVHETEKKWKLFIRNIKLILKKQVKMFVFISWKQQVKMLVFISWLVSFGVCIQIQYFCDVERNKLQTINIYLS